MNTTHEISRDDMICQARRRIASLSWIPSPILFEALRGVRDEKGPEEISIVIEKDPSLTSVVLKVSNSAFFGCRGKIDSIPRAIVTLGQKEVRLLILSILVHQQLNTRNTHPAFSMERFWRHSFLTALAARELTSSDAAYLHGLIHDIGLIVMATFLQDLYGMAAQIATERDISLYEAETEVGLTHTAISTWLGARWCLPPVLRAALSHHHEPENAGAFQKETAVIAVADTLARMAEKGKDAARPSNGRQNDLSMDETILGLAHIPAREYLSLWRRMPCLLEKAHSLWMAMETSS